MSYCSSHLLSSSHTVFPSTIPTRQVTSRKCWFSWSQFPNILFIFGFFWLCRLQFKCLLLQESFPIHGNWHISTSLTSDAAKSLSSILPCYTFSTGLTKAWNILSVLVPCCLTPHLLKCNKGHLLSCFLLNLHFVICCPVINISWMNEHFKPNNNCAVDGDSNQCRLQQEHRGALGRKHVNYKALIGLSL